MNKEEATKFLALIKIAYPKAYRNMDNDSILATVIMWQKTFADVPYEIMEIALDHFRKISEFEPTVASMYKELKSLHYTAVVEALSADSEEMVRVNKYIMEHTSRFKEDINAHYQINYSSINKLMERTENPMLEGGMHNGD